MNISLLHPASPINIEGYIAWWIYIGFVLMVLFSSVMIIKSLVSKNADDVMDTVVFSVFWTFIGCLLGPLSVIEIYKLSHKKYN